MEPTPQRILEIVVEQRSVTDETIAPQIAPPLSVKDVATHTKLLEKQGLIAENPLSAGRWHVTDAGRSALEAG